MADPTGSGGSSRSSHGTLRCADPERVHRRDWYARKGAIATRSQGVAAGRPSGGLPCAGNGRYPCSWRPRIRLHGRNAGCLSNRLLCASSAWHHHHRPHINHRLSRPDRSLPCGSWSVPRPMGSFLRRMDGWSPSLWAVFRCRKNRMSCARGGAGTGSTRVPEVFTKRTGLGGDLGSRATGGGGLLPSCSARGVPCNLRSFQRHLG